MSIIALEILTAFIKSDPTCDNDVDRTIAMSAYMAKKLEADMLKPIEQLEMEVWPASTSFADSTSSDNSTDNSTTGEDSNHDL